MTLATPHVSVPPASVLPGRRMSRAEFELLPDHSGFELVDGQLRELGMGFLAQAVAGGVVRVLGNWNYEAQEGVVASTETLYWCFPDGTGRKADASFVRFDRLDGDELPEENLEIPPDLAVEVVSPSDMFEDVEAKVRDWLKAGVRMVWVVDPKHRFVRVYDPSAREKRYDPGDTIPGGEVLPGFAVDVAEFFPPPRR